jgi:uncharacterized protein YbjT (DUF2867 family)
MKNLLTGSSGFVGGAPAKSILASNFGLVAPTRSGSSSDSNSRTFGLAETIDAQQLHVLRSVNIDGMPKLARQAVLSGVQRLFFSELNQSNWRVDKNRQTSYA